MLEYIAPEFDLTIGEYNVRKIKGFDVFSSRINPIDCAEIHLDVSGVPSGSITKGQPVEIWQGYREKGIWKVFSGVVVDVSYKRTITVYCKDAMENLRATTITKSFVNVRPQEIVRFTLAEAGIAEYALSQRVLPHRHTFVVSGKSGIDVIKLVNRTWGLEDWCFYMEPEGEFFWGAWEESKRYLQGEMVTLEFGKNLLDLKPSNEETGELTTVALPFVRHSEVVRIIDERFWAREVLARVERIQYHHGEQARSYIQWRILKS